MNIILIENIQIIMICSLSKITIVITLRKCKCIIILL